MGRGKQFRGARGRVARILFAAMAWTSLTGAMVVSMVVSTARADDVEANEYEIKAAYLLNFPNFVDWPGAANSVAQSPIRLCLLGADPLGSALSRMVADRLSRGRSVLLRRVDRNEAMSDCQILYISPSATKFIPQILDSLHAASVLTVGESDQFAAQGGMIQLVMEDNRIRFKINPTAASQAGLRISSKLLALAQIVAPATSSSPAAAVGPRPQITLKDQSLKTYSPASAERFEDAAGSVLSHT